ncbi:hypothetical protein Ga0074812_107202 [Parafrankia irregularis]|uniref:Uncharacterized protein n=1 Tax=Parafrankia irregularis TaxID=795642 RepID=A0A0S4QMJ6_9ACTN|nr:MULTISPECIES: hypothetical protein [Parafrankia]MBE3201239.1 hypothetical protein [Parafrankia sp. CH37]CUU56318.1 hypothetical protein Ga0074812_107202 [Parafrankia irregularis]
MRKIIPRDAGRDDGRSAAARGLSMVLGRRSAGRFAQRRSSIEVGTDWRRCGAGDGGCGVLLPLSQPTCPRCGRTNREDLAPLDLRRALLAPDAGEDTVTILRPAAVTAAAPASPSAAVSATSSAPLSPSSSAAPGDSCG